MTAIKTAELSDAALDWAVGEIEFSRLIAQGSHVKQWVLEDHRAGRRTDPWSTDWQFGGPIIDCDRVLLQPEIGKENAGNAWSAISLTGHVCYGPTPLIAAMRCYVASKMGDTVDVPDNLE